MTADIKIPYSLSTFGGTGIKVELDKKALFALASDTRLEILKSLQCNRRTVSQLAESVGVDKAAVHRHLKKLEEGGFVTRSEDHGFVYYGLTWKARDLMSPGENTRIVVLLSSSFITVMVVLVLTFSLLTMGFGSSAPIEGSDSNEKTDSPGQYQFIPQVSLGSILFFLPFLMVLSAASFYLGWKKLRKPVLRGGEEVETLYPPTVAD